MIVVKIVIFCIVCSVISVFIKNNVQEIYSLFLLCSGIIILLFIIKYISSTLSFFKEFYDYTGLDSQIITLLLKILAICYIVEFGTSIVEDVGIKTLSNKIFISGKLVIFVMTIPIFKEVLNILTELIK